jgi:hypothetical protein
MKLSPNKMYRVVRHYANHPGRRRVIKRHLTDHEAYFYTQDPETSSRTCRRYRAKLRTKLFGPWFDSWEVET